MIDQLTNIPNRRSFDARLSVEWKQAIREQLPISLLMMDLDRFKILNDTYGHQQGDIVLKTIAEVFTRSLRRPADFTARWGGEEFIVLLPNTPLEGAVEVAEHIRTEVENTVIPVSDGTKIKITISIGATSIKPEQKSSMYFFISCADKALYMAKDTGRNKVVGYVG
jgi:diguanylate cyclase (GGDEF)-like protein